MTRIQVEIPYPGTADERDVGRRRRPQAGPELNISKIKGAWEQGARLLDQLIATSGVQNAGITADLGQTDSMQRASAVRWPQMWQPGRKPPASARNRSSRSACIPRRSTRFRWWWEAPPKAAVVEPSVRVAKERQKPLFTDMPDSHLPQISLLDEAPDNRESIPHETLEMTSRLIEKKLKDFGVDVVCGGGRAGAGGHALRDRAGDRRQGRADRQSGQGSVALSWCPSA